MSRPTSAVATRGSGRHRLGRAAGVRAADLPAVRERLQASGRGTEHRSSFLRWLFTPVPTGRHTWSFLAHSGGRPRTAFAIILSL